MSSNSIFVTGGAGFIGSHTAVELLASGYDVVIFDNLENANASVVDRIADITGRRPTLIVGDIRDRRALVAALAESRATAVMHFAGLKSVTESCAEPFRYYDTNIIGTLRVIEAMAEIGVNKMVFSSSTTVYGDAATAPVTEDAALGPICPYGRTKLMAENILNDVADVPGSRSKFAILRYFNPVGAHESGLIGEDPLGTPTNLMPIVCQVASGRRKQLDIFGKDYPTKDGTAVRDFIHVVDLAKGHLAALRSLENSETKVITVNLGTGTGVTVQELVTTFEEVNEVRVPHVFTERRQGDVGISFADASKARDVLGWRAERGVAEMCRDAWTWQTRNPHGYRADRQESGGAAALA